MTKKRALFTSKSDSWETPEWLFSELNLEFKFTLDAAASEANHLCLDYFSENNCGIKNSWKGHNVFCNPPYKTKLQRAFIMKAHYEYEYNNVTSVLLIPARTETKAWHEHIFKSSEIRFVKGRLRFNKNGEPAPYPSPFPSAVIIFDPSNVRPAPKLSFINQ